MSQGAPHRRQPLAFFAVALALAVPIWLLSLFVGVVGSLKVPLTDLLLAFTPLLAGAILVLRSGGLRAAAIFLGRTVDIRSLRPLPWAATALLLAPAVYAVTYWGLHWAGHPGEPTPSAMGLPLLTLILFLLAIGEEAGWTGYLLDPLQARFGALGASLIIAVPWWAAHIPSILQIGGGPMDLIWWIPGAIALRIVMTWLYNNTGGSVLAVVLFHTILNIGRVLTYPTVGTHYDPVYQATGYAIFSAIALLAVAVWGPQRLSLRPLVIR